MTVIELLEEMRADNSRWYAIYKNGEFVTGSHSKHKALEWYKLTKESRFVYVSKVVKRTVINKKEII